MVINKLLGKKINFFYISENNTIALLSKEIGAGLQYLKEKEISIVYSDLEDLNNQISKLIAFLQEVKIRLNLQFTEGNMNSLLKYLSLLTNIKFLLEKLIFGILIDQQIIKPELSNLIDNQFGNIENFIQSFINFFTKFNQKQDHPILFIVKNQNKLLFSKAIPVNSEVQLVYNQIENEEFSIFINKILEKSYN